MDKIESLQENIEERLGRLRRFQLQDSTHKIKETSHKIKENTKHTMMLIIKWEEPKNGF